MAQASLHRTQIDTYVACPCGRTDPTGATDEQGSREYTCRGCGRVYLLSWRVEIAPTDKTGSLDLMGHLRQTGKRDTNSNPPHPRQTTADDGTLYCPNDTCDVRDIPIEDAVHRSATGLFYCPQCDTVLVTPPTTGA